MIKLKINKTFTKRSRKKTKRKETIIFYWTLILKRKITLTRKIKRIRTIEKIINHKLGWKVKLKTNKIFIKGLRRKN